MSIVKFSCGRVILRRYFIRTNEATQPLPIDVSNLNGSGARLRTHKLARTKITIAVIFMPFLIGDFRSSKAGSMTKKISVMATTAA